MMALNTFARNKQTRLTFMKYLKESWLLCPDEDLIFKCFSKFHLVRELSSKLPGGFKAFNRHEMVTGDAIVVMNSFDPKVGLSSILPVSVNRQEILADYRYLEHPKISIHMKTPSW